MVLFEELGGHISHPSCCSSLFPRESRGVWWLAGSKDKCGGLVIFEINDFHTCQYHVRGGAGNHTSIVCAYTVLAGRGRLRGTGYLHLISFFPGPRWDWEESRAFWCCSFPVRDLFGPVLYHRATVRLSVTRHRH